MSASRPPFELVDLFDLGRGTVRHLAYCKATQELFVSFEVTPADAATTGDTLQQWSTADARLLHTYPMEKGFTVDDLSLSPDCQRLVVALYRGGSPSSGPWGKYALLDPAKHASLSADLGLHDDRGARLEQSPSGERFRLTGGTSVSGVHTQIVFDTAGRPATPDPTGFPAKPKGKAWVLESTQSTISTHGLYYTDAQGQDHRVTADHWHDNYDVTQDGRYVVTTTWSGDVLAWSTAEQKVAFTAKLGDGHAHLVYDEKSDRFLIGDATSTGTTQLRALVRVRGTE